MCQSLPHQGFPEKHLLWLLEGVGQLRIAKTGMSLFSLLWVDISIRGDPRFLDANPQVVTCSSVCIGITTGVKGTLVDIEDLIQKYM